MKTQSIACTMAHFKPSPQLIATALLALNVHAVQAYAQESTSPGQQFQLALEAQTDDDYGAMLTLLRAAGAANHLPAQEMLAMVLLVGPSMYGNAVQANRCEAGRWIRQALKQGSVVARHQWAFLGRLGRGAQGSGQCQRM